MKIQIWSDYVCPFCYIGKKQMELAIASLGIQETVSIEMRAFELDPHAPKTFEGKIEALLAKKYGMSLEQAKAGNERIARMAEAAGLSINFENMKYTNTFDAHRLTKYAAEKGLEKDFLEALLKAYFEDSKLISDVDTLIEVGVSVGLETNALRKIIESDAYGDAVRSDEALAKKHGISSVPYFVIDDQYGVSGAQSVERFKEILTSRGNELFQNANF